MELILIIFYLGLVILNGMVADAKNYSVGWCMLGSILLTPILVYLYLLAVPPIVKSPEEKKADYGKFSILHGSS